MSANTESLREKVARKLAANPTIKTGMLAETLGVPEADVLRAMPAGHAIELSIDDLEAFASRLDLLGLVYFIVWNAGCVAEIKGRFGGFGKSGPFFNVDGEGLHLHLRLDRIATVFHVTPRGPDGRLLMPSLQFYLASGVVSFKIFLIEQMQVAAGDDYARSLEALASIVAPHRPTEAAR